MNTDPHVLSILCAGASKGLVEALQDDFLRDTGARLSGRFGAVGAMKEALLAGEPCDVMVVTAAMVDALCADGLLRGDTRADLGRVRTGVAVRAGEPVPDVSSPDALRHALLAARTLYFPDPVRATAGIHFAGVMQQLGVHEALQPRLRTFPNGATSMRELAASQGPGQLGCTQISEILYTPGVQLAGPLPDRFELATGYTAAVACHAAQPALAQRFVALLAGPGTRAQRERGGFDMD